MPDNKLTDSEIIKALECAIRNDCDCNCVFLLPKKVKDVLDLINRLQADCENLKAEVDILHSDYTYNFVKERAKAEAEAYKECIEKVKEKLKNIAKIEWQDNYYYLVGTAFFDNLLKELVGDSQ